jgi:hypothetical protein
VIADPDENSERFHVLEAGDFVVIDFSGDLEPISAKAVFVAQKAKKDKVLHKFLDDFMSGKSMSAISASDLQNVISKANLPLEHPANLGSPVFNGKSDQKRPGHASEIA